MAFVAVIGLLFQQLAMAAYLCPLEAQSVSASMLNGSAQTLPCHRGVDVDKARCHEHCHPTVPAADHVSALAVPALLAATASRVHCDAGVGAGARLNALERALAAHTHPPPLTVQHCTFQI